MITRLRLLGADLLLDTRSPEQVIGDAAQMVAEGASLPALVALAGADPFREPCIHLLSDALADLGGDLPTRREAVALISRRFAQGIVDGTETPIEGARRIWWTAREEPDNDESLAVFVGLASEWEDSPDHRAAYDADIVAAARSLLDE